VTGIRVNLALGGTPAQREASGLRLVVTGARGARITVGLTSRAQVEAVRAWLVQVADVVEQRWRRELDAGRTCELGPRIQLTASSLEHRGKRIDLTQPFTLEEVPGYGAPPLLRVSGPGDRIVLQGDFDNYAVLVRHLRRLQRG
jgi:hypothetical protein